MPQCPINKSAFKFLSSVEIDALTDGNYQKITWQERLRIANYLNSIVYSYPFDNPPKLDRTKFKAHSISESQD